MTKTEIKQLHNSLYAEFRKNAMGKRYVGPHKTLRNQEGFAWLSTAAYGRWCFIPLRSPFSIDTVMVVNATHLTNL